MNWIDAVVLAVWGISALWGFSTGLIRVSISLLVVIVGLAVSSRIAEDVGNIFSGLTDSEGAQTVGGFILVFLGLFIIGAVASFFIGTLLRFLPLFGLANRFGGIAVGVIIGFLLLSGILTGTQKFTDTVDDDIDESTLGAFLADNFDVVIRGVKLIPGDWDNELKKLQNKSPADLLP
jgi:uncharacterized membrane protein required for colicin V production